jgi:hypothetical protein
MCPRNLNKERGYQTKDKNYFSHRKEIRKRSKGKPEGKCKEKGNDRKDGIHKNFLYVDTWNTLFEFCYGNLCTSYLIIVLQFTSTLRPFRCQNK